MRCGREKKLEGVTRDTSLPEVQVSVKRGSIQNFIRHRWKMKKNRSIVKKNKQWGARLKQEAGDRNKGALSREKEGGSCTLGSKSLVIEYKESP